MKDPYAPESETTALIKTDTHTPAERELARLMAEAGDGEQGFEPEAALQWIALSLIEQLQDARTEVVALHATEQNLRDGIASQEDGATPPTQPAVPLTEKDIANACLSYRHDFGLMHQTYRELLMFEAREWARAFGLNTTTPKKDSTT
jgi:hypothetical protein